MHQVLRKLVWPAALAFWFGPAGPGAAPGAVDFNREIRPILSDNCFSCHGPDPAARKADLRLDRKESALADLGGHFAVVPGSPEKSEVYRKITAADPADRMPPSKTGKRLSPDQVEKIRRWIDEGANWQDHWSFVSPTRPELPPLRRMDWPRNPIDHFVLARLEAEGLEPSPEASRETLIRRVTLDLTGLPPTLPEVEAFLADANSGAYERVVDRLLQSPRYGQQMARYWLDAARYGDTHGLHLDNERSIWPYRDWVVDSFNRNLPFDEFTIEQLAGDLLPNPSREQLTATGFNRCNVTTSEGGAIPEEFRVRYAVDRTETMATVWMGLTAGCAVCHDHKFDPISQKEFYQLYAFFNSVDENPMDGNALLPPPVAELPTAEEERRLREYGAEIAQVERMLKAAVRAAEYQEPLTPEGLENQGRRDYVWVDDTLPEGAKASTGDSAWQFISAEQHPVRSGQKSHTRTAEKTSQHYFTDAKDGLRIGTGDTLFTSVYLDEKNPPKAIMLQFNDGNWDHRIFWGEDVIDFGEKNTPGRRAGGPLPEAGQWVRLEVNPSEVGLGPGTVVRGWAFTQFGGTVYWDESGIRTRTPQGQEGFTSLLAWEEFQKAAKGSGLPDGLRKALLEESGKRTDAQRQEIRDYFLAMVYPPTRAVLAPMQERLNELKREREAVDRGIVRTLITKEMAKPRDSYVLIRGAYDKPGEKVSPGVPSILPELDPEAPRNRLGLARWLVGPKHPLTARVTANRLWQQHFGVGLVKTAEDFGSQGEPPSHPGLLDWLATEFMESGWDVKALQRLIVTSATYRQSSRLTPGLAATDAENRLLARGPRFRMDAEMIRDSALAISGLLVEKAGGHGVKPYQPEGIWKAVAYPSSNTAKYQQDHGETLYRRSLYSFWKRTAPPPSMVTFDAPSRESCRVRRERTNTPLQALVLMNDEQFVEAARHLAERMLREGGTTVAERLNYGYRLVTAHPMGEREAEVLGQAFQAHLTEYQQNPGEAKSLVTVGESPVAEDLEKPEWAAYTMVASLMLNLSEAVTLN